MKTTLLLADWAEVVNGKLYAQGIGWSGVAANQPVNMGICIISRVDYNETNQPHRLDVRLVDADGQPVLNTEQKPMFVGFEFEIGRHPGIVHGESQTVVLAANAQSLVFPPGRYTWDVYYNDTKIPESFTFSAIARRP